MECLHGKTRATDKQTLVTCIVLHAFAKYSYEIHAINIHPLVPGTHYSECQDEPFSLQVQRLEIDLKLSCGFIFFAPWALMG